MSTDTDIRDRRAPLCYSRKSAGDDLRPVRFSALMTGLLLLGGVTGGAAGWLAASATSHSQPGSAFDFASPSTPTRAVCEAPPHIAIDSDASASRADLIGDAITIGHK